MSHAWRTSVACSVLLIVAFSVRAKGDDSTTPPAKPPETEATPIEVAAKPRKSLFKGKVVRVIDALKRRGVKAHAEELKEQVALESDRGDLIPILPDWRGRAFFQDERLRNRDVELIGFRREGIPYLNVLSVYTFGDKGERQYTDYWCDICSIPMYEIKPCDCCQQDIRLRFQVQELPQDLNAVETAKPTSPK
jgi:hypothetical protein